MKRKDAEVFLPLVNDNDQMKRLLSYMEYRILVLKESLTSSQNFEDVKRLQGAIEELRRFKSLREEVINSKD